MRRGRSPRFCSRRRQNSARLVLGEGDPASALMPADGVADLTGSGRLLDRIIGARPTAWARSRGSRPRRSPVAQEDEGTAQLQRIVGAPRDVDREAAPRDALDRRVAAPVGRQIDRMKPFDKPKLSRPCEQAPAACRAPRRPRSASAVPMARDHQRHDTPSKAAGQRIGENHAEHRRRSARAIGCGSVSAPVQALSQSAPRGM